MLTPSSDGLRLELGLARLINLTPTTYSTSPPYDSTGQDLDFRFVFGDRRGNRNEMAFESVSRGNVGRFMEHFASRGRW